VGFVVGLVVGWRLRDARAEVVAPPPSLPRSSPPPQAVLDEVRTLAKQGQLIAAIKRYRELTGADLRTSKEAVEQLQKE
jgi:ribosomal protein L7/L12